MKQLALETINIRYPEQMWLHVYTDGSLMNREAAAGAGITCKLFSFYISLGKYTTHYDGELQAILTALQQLFLHINSFQNAVILSDSSSAIMALTHNQTIQDHRIIEAKNCIRMLKNLNRNVVLQWIPAHCGVEGNEKADMLAKKGTLIQQSKINYLSYKSVQLYTKMKIKSHIAEQNKIQCETKIWKTLLEPDTIPNSPRSIAVASFRLETGHDCLAAHLHRIKLLDSPHCIVCKDTNTIMNKDHLMFCADLQKIVGTPFQIAEYYWEARKRMMTNQELQNI